MRHYCILPVNWVRIKHCNTNVSRHWFKSDLNQVSSSNFYLFMSNLCAFLIQYFAIDFLNFLLFVLIHYGLCHTQFVVKLIGQTLPPVYEPQLHIQKLVQTRKLYTEWIKIRIECIHGKTHFSLTPEFRHHILWLPMGYPDQRCYTECYWRLLASKAGLFKTGFKPLGSRRLKSRMGPSQNDQNHLNHTE